MSGDELTPEQREAIEKAANEKAYGNFKSFMDRYREESKSQDDVKDEVKDEKPSRTTKPKPTFWQDLFGG